jgi:hypothetical protein
MNIDAWQRYANCWSAPAAERNRRLDEEVSRDVHYRDPNMEVSGIDGLASYMSGFQQALPGHRFEIRSVMAHHARSLARWQQVDQQGNPVAEGASFAAHDEQGRFCDITGFFPVAGA